MYTFARFVLLFVAVALPTQLLFAQTSGLSLTPHTIEEVSDPGQTLTSVIELENLSEEPESYFLFVRDIEGVAENGRPLYVTDDFVTNELNLSQWISLTRTTVDLAPGERVSIPFAITVPENAPPGGHFGGIFGALEPPDADTNGAGAEVGYRVGNIINIRVSGDVIEEADIRSFQTDKFVYGTKDVQFLARVENTGNVLVRPVGPVSITNMLGDQVAQVTMNESKAGVFPNSIREIEGEWQENGLGFGRYVAEVAMVYGVPGEAQYTITGNATFWVMPWEIIRPLLIVLVISALVAYIFVRQYINRQVRKLSGGRRLVRSTAVNGPSPLLLASIIMLFVTAFILFVLLLVFA